MIATLAAAMLLGNTPDFAGVLHSPKLGKAAGERKVLLILWDPQRPTEKAPPRSVVESLVFGRENSVAGWFRENSQGKLKVTYGGVLGWYQAEKPAENYWGPPDEGDADKDGFVDGHVLKWTEAIRKADREFDFKAHDKNGNGVLDPTDLSILIVIPQNTPFGTGRVPAGRQHPQWEPLVCDGVRIPVITEAYAGLPLNLGLFAHELCHQLVGAPDQYQSSPYRAGLYSLMDCSYQVVHLDPFLKLKLGWLKPKVIDRPAKVELSAISRSGEAILLWDPKKGTSEYFLIENRFRKGSYDRDLPADGVAVWHVIEDPTLYSALPLGQVDPNDWGRRSLRLLRSGGNREANDHRALYGPSDVCRPAWADGTPSGFAIQIKGSGSKVQVEITR